MLHLIFILELVSLLIGVGRFRILRGGQGLEYCVRGGGGGGGRGGKGGQFPAGTMTLSFRRHVPTRFLINQCQIITFLILKFDNIENSRIQLKGIVLPVPSNQI